MTGSKILNPDLELKSSFFIFFLVIFFLNICSSIFYFMEIKPQLSFFWVIIFSFELSGISLRVFFLCFFLLNCSNLWPSGPSHFCYIYNKCKEERKEKSRAVKWERNGCSISLLIWHIVYSGNSLERKSPVRRVWDIWAKNLKLNITKELF
jgi:hypothetical protein